jgi:hypothetical protein
MHFVLYAQQGGLVKGMSDGTQSAVVIDPLLQSYEAIMQLPSGEINKDLYQLGFGDVITIVIRGRYPMILKSHVLTASMDVYLPQLGFVSLKGLNVTDAELRIQQYIAKEVGDARVEISVEIPRTVEVALFNVDGSSLSLRLPANTSIYEIIQKREKYLAVEDASLNLDNKRPMTMADNVFAKSPQVQQMLLEKNTGEASIIGESPYKIFDYQAYPFNVRSVAIKKTSKAESSFDFFTNWLLSDSKSAEQLNESSTIYLDRKTPATAILTVTGSVRKAFRIPVFESDPFANWFSRIWRANATTYFRTTDLDKAIEITSLEELTEKVRKAVFEGAKEIIVEVTERSVVSIEDIDEGYWYYDTQMQSYQYIQEDVKNFSKEQADDKHFFLFKNANWKDDFAKIQNILLRTNADILEEELDYLQYLQTNQDIISLDATNLSEQFQIPPNYILVSIPKRQEIQLIGPFVQPGNYTFLDSQIEPYLKEAGGLGKAATGKLYIIKNGSFAWYDVNETSLEAGDILYAERKPIDNFQLRRTNRENRLRTYITAFSTLMSTITTIVLISRRR